MIVNLIDHIVIFYEKNLADFVWRCRTSEL